jgi:hypothetical protein
MNKQTLDSALEKTRIRRAHSPSDPLLTVIENQLSFIRKALDGKRSYRFRAERINLGACAADYFGQKDPQYAELLTRSQQILDDLPRYG